MSAPLRNRLAVAAAVLILTPVLLEGATSLFLGRPLSERLLGRPQPAAAAAAALADGAQLTEGPYARDPDPAVGFRLKSAFHPVFAGVESTTDGFGQRMRPGALDSPKSPGSPDSRAAPRIVMLGDSVAYGFGVADDETYAHQLERFLGAVVEPGSPVPEVWTIACPGWNQASSFRYLRNHLQRLDPDIVLYVPVPNDLDDATAINELGWRSMDVDPRPDRPQASIEQSERLRRTLTHEIGRAVLARIQLAGGARVVDHALRTGVTPESDRRWRAFTAEIAALGAGLEARGAHLAVVLPFARDFHRQAEARLAADAPAVPVWGLLAGYTPADSLPTDGHYNAAVLREGARRMAEHLMRAGWISGDPGRLAPPEEGFAERGYVPLEPGTEARELARLHADFLAFVGDRIDLEDVQGIHQVYGGLIGDGTVGRHVFAALARPGATHLELELERLAAESGVYPLSLTLSIDARQLAVRAIPPPNREAGPGEAAGKGGAGADARMTLRAELPSDLRDDPVLDVLVQASAWIEEQSVSGPRLVSFRLLRLALVED